MIGRLALLFLGTLLAVSGGQRITEAAMASVRYHVQNAVMAAEVELVPVYLGRFAIPAVGVDVACYESSAQAVADAKDSAAYFYACGHWVIADHVNQGFGAIKRCKPGDSAQLRTERGTEEFVCIDLIQGHNTGKALTDLSYKPIDDLHPDALVCYTCNDNWRNVTIVFFEPVQRE